MCKTVLVRQRQALAKSCKANCMCNTTTFMCLYSKCNELLLKIWLTPNSSSWEANNCSASQEILCIVWNLKVHWHVHNDLALVPLLGAAGKIQWLSYPISLTHTSHLQLDPAWGTSLQIFPTQTLYHLSSLPSLSSAPPISVLSCTARYYSSRTHHEASHSAVSSTLILLPSL